MVIFYLSAQPAATSNQLSKGVTQVVVEVIEMVTPARPTVDGLNHLVRKYAHFSAYFLLGFFTSTALGHDVKGRRRVIYALLFCGLYAISDEVHQMFVPGRGPQLKDVLIDSAGATIGVFMGYVIEKVIDRYQKRS